MRIFLIGYRGTGKSTVARLLADKLGIEAIDADHELERRAGKTIRRIFTEDGEPRFRELESTLLAEFGQRDDVVIATGGGVVLRPENRAILRTGRVVWLTAPADVLWRRMCGDESTRERRPDLAQGGTRGGRRIVAGARAAVSSVCGADHRRGASAGVDRRTDRGVERESQRSRPNRIRPVG